MATHSSVLAWRIPRPRVHGVVKESDMTQQLNNNPTSAPPTLPPPHVASTQMGSFWISLGGGEERVSSLMVCFHK